MTVESYLCYEISKIKFMKKIKIKKGMPNLGIPFFYG